MKNLRLFKVSRPGGSARADLEPPKRMEFYKLGRLAWFLIRFLRLPHCFRDQQAKNWVFFDFQRFSLKT